MNATETNSGGWASSQMRAYLNGEFLLTAPEELQSVIKSVTKEYNVGTTISTCEDKLWLLSLGEAAVESGGGYTETVTYGTPYTNFDAKLGTYGIANRYWLRNAYSKDTRSFVSVTGFYYSDPATYTV